ncbi:phage portal protein [Clostridioides difficile]|nr:phage portal protein [Clostridioides difficile]MCP3314314.1 phage portal protein [Clostridioides difficile]MCZ8465254.1 phage portal protein [Clostridioides difficile]MDI7814426.1 phage portal protein [Clostridioides difficile]
MNFKNFITNFLFKDKMSGADGEYFKKLEATIFYKEFALRSCISIIANALVLSEFQTFINAKSVKEKNYYLFNIEPNQNQNATEFWQEVITRLVYDNECLVIQENEQLFVAESFNVDKYVFYEDIYKDITIRNYKLDRSFRESDVLYFKLNVESIKTVIDYLYNDYKDLLSSAMKGYKKNNSEKGVLEIDTNYPQTKEAQERLNDLMSNKFKRYFESDNAVLPLSNGLKYTENTKASSIKDSRDIRAIIDDVMDFVCAAFHVPAGLVKGNVSGVEGITDNFLNFSVNPIARLITAEITRKMYGRDKFIEKSYIKVDTQKIANMGLEKISKASDLLFRIGVNSINDNLEMLGREKINESWADEHYVTKNYQSILNPDLKGGVNNGNGKKNGVAGNKG